MPSNDGGFWLVNGFYTTTNRIFTGDTFTNAVDFQIPSGATLSEIAATAEQAGVPINKTQFIALAKYRKVAKSLKAGRYRFAAGKNVGEILQDMSNGKVAAEKISIIEGTTFAKLRIQLAQDNRFAHT